MLKALIVLLRHGFARCKLRLHAELKPLVLIQQRAIGVALIGSFPKPRHLAILLALLQRFGKRMRLIIGIHIGLRFLDVMTGRFVPVRFQQ